MRVAIIIPTTSKELVMAEESKQAVLDSTYKNVNVFIINEGKERSAQRNIGIDHANTGEFDCILYLDSDQKVSKYLIEECVDLIKAGFDALYIPEEITTEGGFAKVRNYERSFYNGTAVDCVRFMRVSMCPKFSLDLNGPEDSDHDRRVGGKRTVTKNCLYHHDRIGFKDYFRKKDYYAKSMRKYANLHPNDKVLKAWYRCFWIFIEEGKWKKIIRHPIMFLCVIGIVFVRAIIYLKNR